MSATAEQEAARMIGAVCREMGASPSTCLIVPGLLLEQLEWDRTKRDVLVDQFGWLKGGSNV